MPPGPPVNSSAGPATPEPARRSTLSRRGFLTAGGVAAGVGISVAALDLPFFSVAGAAQDPMACRATDLSASEARMVISNWTGYIDPRNKPGSTLADFTASTGIEVEYNVDVNDNAEFYAKVKNQLGECEPVDPTPPSSAASRAGSPTSRTGRSRSS